MTSLHQRAREESTPALPQGRTPPNLCALTVPRIGQDHHPLLQSEDVENRPSPCVVGPQANPATMVAGRLQNLKIGWPQSPHPPTGTLLHSADAHPPQAQVCEVGVEAQVLMNAAVQYTVCPPPIHQLCNQLCKLPQSLLLRANPRRTRKTAPDKL
jgi:hypothetical protein